MKKTSILVMLILLTLACDLFSRQPTPPFETPTARVEIIYLPPKDMNLQPGEISELLETEVENPTEQPLLSEATEQDQRAFENVDQDIRVESNIILVPRRTTRSPGEIFDQVIPQRLPEAQRTGQLINCLLGEECQIISILAPCGPGYVLVAIRNNVITFIIGCGRGMTEELALRIGGIIDGRIIAPLESTHVVQLTPAGLLTPTSIATDTPDAFSPTLTFESSPSFMNSTTICTCDSCNGSRWRITISFGEAGNLSGDLFELSRDAEYPFLSFSGERQSFSGERTQPSNCENQVTWKFDGKFISDYQIEATMQVVFTAGNCAMDNCNGVYSFTFEPAEP
ncbi:MAG: hypothetical protein AB1894_17460 [Chloroflexota bacterium]